VSRLQEQHGLQPAKNFHSRASGSELPQAEGYQLDVHTVDVPAGSGHRHFSGPSRVSLRSFVGSGCRGTHANWRRNRHRPSISEPPPT
jgi:hypothetical protein